jgi:hypothetical protein
LLRGKLIAETDMAMALRLAAEHPELGLPKGYWSPYTGTLSAAPSTSTGPATRPPARPPFRPIRDRRQGEGDLCACASSQFRA